MRPSVLLLALALGACASTGENSYQNDLEKLNADCEARGGILAPTGGQSGRPETDNVCKIVGRPASRIGS